MTEAIIGLVGVLIGGLISGGATFVMARRAERNNLRTSARLVEAELGSARDMFAQILGHVESPDLAEKGARYFSEDVEAVSTSAWEAHKAILAAGLSSENWYLVERPFVAIQAHRRWEQQSDRAASKNIRILEEDLEKLVTWLEEALIAVRQATGGTGPPWLRETVSIHAVPVVETVEPALLSIGEREVDLTGHGFIERSTVQAAEPNGYEVACEVLFLSPSLLRVTLDTSAVASPGSLVLTVVSPAPGGGQSEPVLVVVR